MPDYPLPRALITPAPANRAPHPTPAAPPGSHNPVVPEHRGWFEVSARTGKAHHYGPYAMDQERILYPYVRTPGQPEPTLYYSQTPEDGNLAPAPKAADGRFGPYLKIDGKLIPLAAFPAGTPGTRYYSNTDPDLDLADAPEHGHTDTTLDAAKRGVVDGLRNPFGWSAGNLVALFGGSPEQIALAKRIGDSPLGEGLAQLAELAGASPTRIEQFRQAGKYIELLIPAYGTTRALDTSLANTIERNELSPDAAEVLSRLRQELALTFAKPGAPPGKPPGAVAASGSNAPGIKTERPEPKGLFDLLVRRTGPDGRTRIGLLASPNKPALFPDLPVLAVINAPGTSPMVSRAYVAQAQIEMNITIHTHGLSKATPVQLKLVTDLIKRNVSTLNMAWLTIRQKTWSVPDQKKLKAYFGNAILDDTPLMQTARDYLAAHLMSMGKINKEYLQPGGLERISLFTENTRPSRTTAFVVGGDPERHLFLNTTGLKADRYVLHEIAHHATLRNDFWYIQGNPLAPSGQKERIGRSDFIMNTNGALSPSAATQEFVFELTKRLPDYEAWHSALEKKLSDNPLVARAQKDAEAARLFETDPQVRTLVAIHNPDNLSLAAIALATLEF